MTMTDGQFREPENCIIQPRTEEKEEEN